MRSEDVKFENFGFGLEVVDEVILNYMKSNYPILRHNHGGGNMVEAIFALPKIILVISFNLYAPQDKTNPAGEI